MSKVTDASFDRLPKWAQAEITRLEANVEFHKSKVEELLGELGDSSNTNVHIVDGMDDRPLPKDTRVKFTMPNGREITVYLSRRDSENRLEIYGDHRGQLAFLSEAGNTGKLAVLDR